jgi:hypothetical protein
VPPAAAVIAVRLPLLLTGKPATSPLAAFAAPRARSSWFGEIVVRVRAPNARAVNTLSEKTTRVTPMAGNNRSVTSLADTSVKRGVGNPAGIVPTTLMPSSSNENSPTTAAAATTAISGNGAPREPLPAEQQ